MRCNIFSSMIRCALNRLAALRAETTAQEGVEAACFNLRNVDKSLETVRNGLMELLRAERNAQWISNFVSERVAAAIPTHVRQLLAHKYHTCADNANSCGEISVFHLSLGLEITLALDTQLRAARGQCGHYCEGCGAVGLYQVECPTCEGHSDAPVPYRMPVESFRTGGGGGHLSAIGLVVEVADVNNTEHPSRKFCVMPTSPQSENQFFLGREPTGRTQYPARSRGEANLHAVFRKAIEILKAEQKELNSPLAASLQTSGLDKGPQYCFDRIWHEDRHYFKRKLEGPSSLRHAHYHRGFLRAIDGDIGDYGEVTKRGLAYCFDRSAKHGAKRHNETLRNFCKDPRAGKRSIHSYKDWVQVSSTNLQHATTSRITPVKSQNAERAFEVQKPGSGRQNKFIQLRRKICSHLLSLILREIRAEAKREAIIVNELPEDHKQKQVELIKLEKARYEAGDRIMRIVAEYGALTAVEESDYLLYTIATST